MSQRKLKEVEVEESLAAIPGIVELGEDRVEKKESKPKLWTFLDVKEVLESSGEEPDWLWHGVLPIDGVALFCAKPKVGKSTFLRHLAMSVSRGEPFLDRETKQSKVCYLALEETSQIVGPEIRKVGWDPGDRIHIRFGSAPQGDHKRIIDSLKEHIHEGDYGLLIVDTVGRLVRVKQGNDYSEVTKALELIVDLARQCNCAVVITHHLGKGDRAETGDGALGSTAYFAAVDVCIDMKKSNGVRSIDSVGRYGEQFGGAVIRFDPETHRLSIQGTVAEIETKSTVEKIKDVLQDNGARTRDEIKQAVGGNGAKFSEAFRACIEQEIIVRIAGDGKRNDPRKFVLSEVSS